MSINQMATINPLDPPPARGNHLFRAALKSTAADFRVSEQLTIDFDGVGEHLFLHLQKRDLNTQSVIDYLQQSFGVGSVDVGVSGMKDRRAITSQWFSIRTPETAAIAGFEDSRSITLPGSANHSSESVELIASERHGRKLRRGAHQANHFTITLRELRYPDSAGASCDEPLLEQIDVRLQDIKANGFPNYFGPQRFGFNGENLARAQRYLGSSGSRSSRRLTRQKRGLYLSAARSAIFNMVCGMRVMQGSWATLIEGEPPLLAGSRSFFRNHQVNGELMMRCATMDVHPSGPLWGGGDVATSGECHALEEVTLLTYASLQKSLERAGMDQERRALRALPASLKWQWLSHNTLQLDFMLERGVFATSLLAELMPVFSRH